MDVQTATTTRPADPRPVAHPIRIGCAGWNIPAGERPMFDADGSVLQRYASRLDAVEINSSFYRAHRAQTYARWAASVPDRFRFSVKVPKAITHEHRLAGTQRLLERFLADCLQLGHTLGALLVQVPPSLRFDGRTANAFFGMLRRRLPEGMAIACEPRHASWFGDKARRVWSRFDIHRVGADPSPIAGEAAALPGTEGRCEYWRLHGSPRMYYSAYAPEFLEQLAGRVRAAATYRPVWVIFDNTAAGHAVADALALQRLVATWTSGGAAPDA